MRKHLAGASYAILLLFLFGVVPAKGDLEIFLDTAGPQVVDIYPTMDPDGGLFGPDGVRGPGFSLTVKFQDRPMRAEGFLYGVFDGDGPSNANNYELFRYESRECYLLGTVHSSKCAREIVPIDEVIVTEIPPVAGEFAMATVELIFENELASGYYEIRVLDYMYDPAGNQFDGDNLQPYHKLPWVPSGDGIPGREFIAHFRVR